MAAWISAETSLVSSLLTTSDIARSFGWYYENKSDSFVGALFEFGATCLTAEAPNCFAIFVFAYLHVRGEDTTADG